MDHQIFENHFLKKGYDNYECFPTLTLTSMGVQTNSSEIRQLVGGGDICTYQNIKKKTARG